MTIRFSSESDCLIWFNSLNHRKSFQMSLFLKDHFVFVPFILFMTPQKVDQCPEKSKCIGPLFPASRGSGQSSGRVTSQSGTHPHFFTSHTDPDTTNLDICWYRYVTDTRALRFVVILQSSILWNLYKAVWHVWLFTVQYVWLWTVQYVFMQFFQGLYPHQYHIIYKGCSRFDSKLIQNDCWYVSNCDPKNQNFYSNH